MTPIEKARELLTQFLNLTQFPQSDTDLRIAKKSTSLCVDYIIKEINKHGYPDVSYILEWETVKQEIQKL
jgi:hypothetical protein